MMRDDRDTAGDAYRASKASIQAKRKHLLTKRRDDLVMLSSELRDTYVARFARISAGIALIVAGGALLAATSSLGLRSELTDVLPGRAPAALCTLLLGAWLLGGMFYMLGRAIGERRFAARIRRTVLPTDDAQSDVDRLAAIGPNAVATWLTHRLEARSLSIPILAMFTLLPASLGYLAMAWLADGYPSADAFETALIARSGSLLAIALCGVAVAAIYPRLGRLRLAGILCAIAEGAMGLVVLNYSLWLGAAMCLASASFLWAARRSSVERATIGSLDGVIAIEEQDDDGVLAEVRAFLARLAGVANTWIVRPTAWTARKMILPAWRGVRKSRTSAQFAIAGMLVVGLGVGAYGVGKSTADDSAQTKAAAFAPLSVKKTTSKSPKAVTTGNRFDMTKVDVSQRPIMGYVSPRSDSSGLSDYLQLSPDGHFVLERGRLFDPSLPSSMPCGLEIEGKQRSSIYGNYSQHGQILSIEPAGEPAFKLGVASSNEEGVPTQLYIAIGGETRAFTACRAVASLEIE